MLTLNMAEPLNMAELGNIYISTVWGKAIYQYIERTIITELLWVQFYFQELRLQNEASRAILILKNVAVAHATNDDYHLHIIQFHS